MILIPYQLAKIFCSYKSFRGDNLNFPTQLPNGKKNCNTIKFEVLTAVSQNI